MIDYTQKRNQAREAYQRKLAQLAYEQGVGEQQFVRKRDELGRQFDRQREQVPWAFAGRGLLRSGLYGRGLQDYAEQRTRMEADLGLGWQQQVAGFQLQQAQAAEELNRILGDIDIEEQIRRAQLAAQLRELK